MEIAVGVFFFVMAFFPILGMNRASVRQTMDAHYEFLSVSAAMEVLEIFRGMGYEEITNPNSPVRRDYQIGVWEELKSAPFHALYRPAEVENLQRTITLTELPGNPQPDAFYPRGVKVKVSIMPKGGSNTRGWFKRDAISLEGIVLEPHL